MKIILNKKVILITGGTGYLGSKIVKDLLKHNCKIILISRKKILKKNINNFVCDLQNGKDVEKTLYLIKNKFKSIDGFIHMASEGILGSIENVKSDDFVYTFNINNIIFFNIVKKLKKLFKKSFVINKQCPSIISVSSIYSKLIPDMKVYKRTKFQNPVSYGVAKAALNHLTKYFASSPSYQNIRFNSVIVGAFPNENINFKKTINRKLLINKIALKRFGQPKELSNLIIFLLSNYSSYIHRSEIKIDGGFKEI